MTNSIDLAKLNKQELNSLFQIVIALDDEKFRAMQQTLRQYPSRISEHTLKLVEKGGGVKAALQYLPFSDGKKQVKMDKRPWKGRIKTGIPGTERMYESEMIVIASTMCASNCVACIRRDYIDKPEEVIKPGDLERLVKYVDEEKLKEILITGGDPLMNPNYTLQIVDSLLRTNIKHLRIGTAMLRADPEGVDRHFIRDLSSIVKNHGKEPSFIEIGMHFDHPFEFSEQTVEKIKQLNQTGFRLYAQTILLKGVNDNESALRCLAEAIRDNNIEWHYLYHCAPVNGNLHLRTSVKKGFKLVEFLEDHKEVTGRAFPKYAILLPIGKVNLDPSRIVGKDGKYLWIETRYTKDHLRGSSLPNFCRVGKKGFLEVKYLDGND